MRELPQYPHPTWTDTIPLMARVELPDIPGMIERGSEKDINPSVKAARGIGEDGKPCYAQRSRHYHRSSGRE